ncbi:MAG: NAD(+)/NADH kinase [Candidatus Coproplasma sp.]
MKVGIYYNKNYLSDNLVYIEKISKAFKARNIQCITVGTFNDLNGLDLLMVLGGDGTILMVASECAKRNVKIIGINYGHMGFLAEFEPDKLDSAIELVCSGNFKTEKRSMLKIEYANKTHYALNDLVIQRSTSGNAFSNTINLLAEIDGSTVDNYTADGLIVSTPTGSTAYSLAAGGSVLTPDIAAFIMTPICAHSLHSRPVVFSDSSTLKIRQVDRRSVLNIIVDGVAVDSLYDFDVISVSKAEYAVEFITSSEHDFFNKLLIKLSIWSK